MDEDEARLDAQCTALGAKAREAINQLVCSMCGRSGEWWTAPGLPTGGTEILTIVCRCGHELGKVTIDVTVQRPC